MAGLVSWIKRSLRDMWQVLHMAGTEFAQENAPLLGAGVAFWAVLSLSPLLVILVVIVSFAYDAETARVAMTEWLHLHVGGQAAQTIISALDKASAPGATTIPGLLSLALMLWGASRFFHALQAALNQIWNVKPKKRGVKRLVIHVARKRALTFALLLSLALLLLASLTLGTALPVVQRTMTGVPGAFYLYRALELLASTVIVSVGVGLIFMILPDVRIPFRFVWKGAFVTGAMLIIGKLLLSWYLNRQTLGSSYGAAGSLAALLVWIYFSTQVFFFGAELTQAYGRIRGVRERPLPEEARQEGRKRSVLISD